MIEYADLLGKPFIMGGYGNGYDCWTLSQEVCRRFSITLPDQISYNELTARNLAFENAKSLFTEINKPKPGTIVTFKLHRDYITHMGVMLDKTRFIHIMLKRSVAVEKITNPFWKSKIEGFYQYVN